MSVRAKRHMHPDRTGHFLQHEIEDGIFNDLLRRAWEKEVDRLMTDEFPLTRERAEDFILEYASDYAIVEDNRGNVTVSLFRSWVCPCEVYGSIFDCCDDAIRYRDHW